MATNFIPKIVYNAGAGDVTIEFDIPPIADPKNEDVSSVGSTTTAADGNEQYSEFYQQEKITLKFKKLTSTQIAALRTMFTAWVLKGNSFDFYQHKSVASYITYTLDKKSFKPKRTSPDGSSDFFYSLDIAARRVL